jgi:hypothetical protein
MVSPSIQNCKEIENQVGNNPVTLSHVARTRTSYDIATNRSDDRDRIKVEGEIDVNNENELYFWGRSDSTAFPSAQRLDTVSRSVSAVRSPQKTAIFLVQHLDLTLEPKRKKQGVLKIAWKAFLHAAANYAWLLLMKAWRIGQGP